MRIARSCVLLTAAASGAGVFPLPPGWSVSALDSRASAAVLKAWHQVHVATREPHDFAHALHPDWLASEAIALGLRGEAKAIALCRSGGEVLCVCTPPKGAEAGQMLVSVLAEEGKVPEWESIRLQPRWHIAFSYLAANRTNGTPPSDGGGESTPHAGPFSDP